MHDGRLPLALPLPPYRLSCPLQGCAPSACPPYKVELSPTRLVELSPLSCPLQGWLSCPYKVGEVPYRLIARRGHASAGLDADTGSTGAACRRRCVGQRKVSHG